MRHVNRSALVPHSAQQMFMLVDDVESYPEFLPWCNKTEIHERSDSNVVATLELHKGGASSEFTTRNERTPGAAIDISLMGGPFRHLAGGWTFKDIGDKGSKVVLKLDFEFESMFIDIVFGSFFEDTCNSLLDAFTHRAEQVFGDQ